MAVTLHQLLKTLVEQGGTDLHVTTNSPPQIRVDGHLVPLQLPHSAGSCGCPNGPSGCPGPFQPNLTIDLGGLSSYDGAQICVAVAPH